MWQTDNMWWRVVEVPCPQFDNFSVSTLSTSLSSWQYVCCVCVCKQTTASFLSQIRQAMYVQCNIQVCSCNHCCPRKAVSITNYEHVSLALIIQHTKRMRHIILLYVACLAQQYFTTLSHKQHTFGEKVQNITCLFWFLPQPCLKYFSFLYKSSETLS